MKNLWKDRKQRTRNKQEKNSEKRMKGSKTRKRVKTEKRTISKSRRNKQSLIYYLVTPKEPSQNSKNKRTKDFSR